MMELKLGDIRQFPFIDPPDPKMIRDGYRLLNDLARLTSNSDSPKLVVACQSTLLACILIDARARNCLDEISRLSAAWRFKIPEL